jgi:hypothetical protein
MPHDPNHETSRIPWMVLAALLLLCAVRGVWFAHGLTVPTDADTVRDIGFIRGIMDGNAWGDPAIAGAWRWYPPLFHAIAAGVAFLTDSDPLPLWNAAGAWLNLATPATFFLMNRRLFGPWQAAAATCVMVLFGGAVMSGDEAAGYTPWTFTPALAWPLFFLGTAAIHRLAPALRVGGAIASGCIVGIVFLAHTVPAILLAGMIAALALAQPSRRPRALLWLFGTGGVALLWSLPFLAPLLFDYRLHIANPVPGAWVHPLFAEPGRMALLSLPALLSVAWLIRIRPNVRAGVLPLLAAWVGICLVFLARQAVCAEGLVEGGACHLLAIAPHHFHVYLQAAEACATGWALSLLAVRIAPRLRPIAAAAGGLAIAAGVVGLFSQPWDRDARAGTLGQPGAMMDRAAYDWIVTHTRPGDRFVTLLPPEADQMGPAAATVIAAGRQLVAPPEIHSNPYVPWAPLNAQRLAYLRAGPNGDRAGSVYFLLPATLRWQGEALLRTPDHAVYRGPDTVPKDWPDKPQAATVPAIPSVRPTIDRPVALRARPG